MGKRPKKWTPTPDERQRQKSAARFPKVATEYPKGVVEYYGENFGFGLDGSWQKVTTSDGGYAITWDTSSTAVDIKEEPKDPLEEFTNEWYEKNKDKL